MNEDLKKRLIEKSKPVEFKKTQGLFTATTLGVGSLMGAGLYVLVGIAAAEAGPSLWIAYGVCGLLTFLSVTMYSDLSKRLPISGGGYIYAYNQLGSFWGFMVGWHLAVGSIFACALYARGFSAYAAAFLPFDQAPFWLTTLMAIILVFVLIALGLRGGKRGDRIQLFFTWGNLAVLAILAAAALRKTDISNFTPMMPGGLKGIGAAISLIYISFFGYQLIANSAEEIRDAKRTVPLAMKLSWLIALVFYIVVALISVATVNWKELAQSDAPLVLVATRGLGSWGVVLIGLGGILASVAALNGTLLSQGRQIYAMGRDKLLPDLLGKVKGKARIPAAAMIAGGVATTVVLVFADLTFIAKAANFALLFSMLPISIALHRLYQKKASVRARETTIRRAVPFAALAANAALLLTLDQQSLMFGGTIIAAGCLVFFSYSYSSEKRGQAGFSVALTEKSGHFNLLKRGERILVPMANPKTQKSLFSISQALLSHAKGEIIALTVVVSDKPREALQNSSGAFRAIDLISRVRDVAKRRGDSFRPVVRAAKSLSEGIAHAATEERADLIVMGWSVGEDAMPSELLRDVISKTHTNAIFVQLTDDVEPKRIGVALGGTGNLSLMVRIAGTLAEQYLGEVMYLNVVPKYFESEHIEHARKVQVEAIQRHSNLVRYHTELLQSDNPLEALVERSKELDLLVVGSAYVNLLDKNIIGSFASMVAEQAHCTVVIARERPPLSKKIRHANQ